MTRSSRRDLLLAKLTARILDASEQGELASILARKRGRPKGARGDALEKYFKPLGAGVELKRQRGRPLGRRDEKWFAWGAIYLECAEKLVCEFNTLTDE
jgi:hypothetical protein